MEALPAKVLQSGKGRDAGQNVLPTITVCPGCWPEALALAQLVLFSLLTSVTMWGTYSKIATNFPDVRNWRDAVCGSGALYLVTHLLYIYVSVIKQVCTCPVIVIMSVLL